MRIHYALSLFILLCSGAVAALAKQGKGAPAPVVNTVMTQALPDYPGKEVQMLTVEYPPGGADPVHRHNANAFVYVLEGSVVMGVAGGKEVTLTPGQTFQERPQDIHTVGRNASQERPAKFVVFLLKDVGKPAFIPVP
jgi:quercetin dioxygenase-like cupin family protein